MTWNGHSFYLKICQNLLNFILEALVPIILKTASLKKKSSLDLFLWKYTEWIHTGIKSFLSLWLDQLNRAMQGWLQKAVRVFTFTIMWKKYISNKLISFISKHFNQLPSQLAHKWSLRICKILKYTYKYGSGSILFLKQHLECKKSCLQKNMLQNINDVFRVLQIVHFFFLFIWVWCPFYIYLFILRLFMQVASSYGLAELTTLK